MPTFYDANNQELSPGQALDVWLENSRGSLFNNDIHLFADAALGYSSPREKLLNAGIEIRFEEKVWAGR